jgi:hypothetical protein
MCSRGEAQAMRTTAQKNRRAPACEIGVLLSIAVCLAGCDSTQATGGTAGRGGGGGMAGAAGAAGAAGPGAGMGGAAAPGGTMGGGPGGAGGGSIRTSCDRDGDCVFQAADGCCGGCLASGAVASPPGQVCAGACTEPPGGCSCVNHVCTRGTLGSGAPCDPAQDACGNGLKCCAICGPVAASSQTPLLQSCEPPVCVQSVRQGDGDWMCPQLV